LTGGTAGIGVAIGAAVGGNTTVGTTDGAVDTVGCADIVGNMVAVGSGIVISRVAAGGCVGSDCSGSGEGWPGRAVLDVPQLERRNTPVI